MNITLIFIITFISLFISILLAYFLYLKCYTNSPNNNLRYDGITKNENLI